MPVLIGTSGWQYRHWRERFYPREVRQSDWLPHYAQRFATVEINATFYRLPEKERFEVWARAVPAGFTFACKASRFLTHIKRLREPEEPVGRMMERAVGLGDRLGPVLLQLPPTLQIDLDRLRATLAAFPASVRVAVEPRHETWFTDETMAALSEHGAALCVADRGGRWLGQLRRTADWAYVRFHWGLGKPDGCYGRHLLDRRAAEIADCWGAGADVYAYFNNDGHACALRDAHTFALACRRHGLEPTRVAAPREVTVG